MTKSPSVGIVRTASQMVRIPSRGGIDPPAMITDFVARWLERSGLPAQVLTDARGTTVGVLATIRGAEPGRSLCLTACIDTAPFGDISQWKRSPASGQVCQGRLLGRGAADSKLGAAVMLHTLRALAASGLEAGTVFGLFDADEHTGAFGGVKAFLAACGHPLDGVVLGYPGNDSLITGARGFLRASVSIHGRSAHSGSVTRRGVNAISRAASFVDLFETSSLPHQVDPEFPLEPSASITRIEGGEAYSQIPDLVLCDVDIRLTPTFDRKAAEGWLRSVIAQFDDKTKGILPTEVEWRESWPAYRIASDSPLVTAFRRAGRDALDRDIPVEVCGPSNIGNYLAQQGIPTICGLGPDYRNLHAANEDADITDLDSVYAGMLGGVQTFMRTLI